MLATQHGIVDRAQLRWFGVDGNAIDAQIAGGRWQQVAPRVYATFTGPLTENARHVAALSYAGPEAVLSHTTAAALWRLRPPVPGPGHVTVPYTRSAVSQPPLVIVHRSRAFRHIAVPGLPPLTSRADTVIDLAVAEPTARAAMALVTSVVTTRRAMVSDVLVRIGERPPRRYRRALRAALERIEGGVHSSLEELYAVDVEAAHGLPTALRQAPVRVDGRTLFEDAVYDHIGVPLTVRLDGSTHLRPEVAHRDRRRDNVAELAGRSRLTFGWRELSERPCAAAKEVAAVLRRWGWVGALRSCPRACECRDWP